MRRALGRGDGILVLWSLLLGCLPALAITEPGAIVGRGAEGEPYPAPTRPPTATPQPDAEGFLPPPVEGLSVFAPLGQAPAADLLLSLDGELRAGDAAALAMRAAADRRPLLLLPWGPWDSEGAVALDRPGARAVLEGLLVGRDGLTRLQGLFHQPSPSGDGACVEVLVHRFPGRASLPDEAGGEPIDGEPVGPPMDGPGPEAAAWRFCRAGAETAWTWETWRSGPYHGLVRRLAARHPGAMYLVLRP